MSDLTIDQVRAAQDSDLDATTAVITALEPRLRSLAFEAARRMGHGGGRLADYVDEFMQVGRVAVWEALPRFQGDTVDAFYGYVHSTVQARLLDAVREERHSGADREAVKTFQAMLKLSSNDAALAEKLCQTVPPKGRRLSAERAHAARLAHETTLSLDAPAPVAEGYGDTSIMGMLSETVASDLGIPDDLVTPDDLTTEASRVKHAIVHSVLDLMGSNQRTVIRYSFGIAGCPCYGYGDRGDDEGLSAEIGMTVPQVRDARSKGLKAFAKRYIKVVARDAEHAAELTAAAAENLGRGGRK